MLLVITSSKSFAVSLNNKDEFIGREAIEQILKKPSEKKLQLFSLKNHFIPGKPLLLHDEPIYFKEKIIGSTTSSNYSFYYKKNIFLAYIVNGFEKQDLYLEVEGKRYPISLEKDPLHDPKSLKMRN